MRFSLGRIGLTVVAGTAVAISPTMAGFASGAVSGGVPLAPAVITLGGQTPTVVLDHQAADLGAGDPGQALAINLVLPLRNQARLTQFLADQAATRQVMTQGQIADLFLPNQSQVDAIDAWATLHKLHVSAVAANRTLVTVEGTTSAIDAALSVQVHNYRNAAGRRFFSNNRDATVPSTLGIAAISGLDNLERFQTSLSTQPLKAALAHAASSVIYKPADFRAAYNVTHDGSGQTIGFTLWGTSVSQSDLYRFASDTGDPAIVSGQSGANGIDWIFPTPALTPAHYYSDALDETAMDVEYAHAMAPNAHLKYYLGDQFSTLDTGCGCYDPTNVGLENAVAAAASPNDPNMHVVSNSWLGSEPTSSTDSFLVATQQSFEIAKAAGITFYFASGDKGSGSGGSAGTPAYPADSPYVVSVGGTALTLNAGAYGSETTWNNASGASGGGCSALSANARPSWQVFTGTNVAPTCSGRAEPDVSADADPSTGAYVDYNGGAAEIGGTSLAAPLWAGMTAAADSYALTQGRTVLPFTGPVIYGCANNTSPYPSTCRSAYHDVTTGNNGVDSAGTGWDEATGWGSINWQTWTQDVVSVQPLTGATASPTVTATVTATRTSTATSTRTATATNTRTATSTSTPTTIGASTPGTATATATRTRTATATATSTSTTIVANTPTVAVTPSATRTATATATSTPVVGSLVGTSSVAPSVVNLTSEGTADWADWGLTTATSFDHKANVSAQFSTYTLVKGGTALRAAVPSQFTWSDGTPDPSGSTTIGVAVNTLGQGFTLGVPASPIVRTLHLYVAVSRAGGQFTAGLSDGSAPLYSSTLDNLTGATVEEYTVRYSAASAGQTLQLSFTMTANHFSGNISLNAATLSQAAAPATSTSTPTTVSVPATSTNTSTAALTGTATATMTPTTTRTATSTSTPTSTTAPVTGTSTSTATATRTATATVTATPTSTIIAPSTPPAAATNTATKAATATATSTPIVGSLAGTSSVAPSAVNLTSEGTADWADWGLSTASSFDHKANVSAQFSTYTLVKGGTALRAAVPSQFSWSDGTPDASGNTTIGVAVNTVGQGFTLGVPASPIVRTLHLYVAVSRAGGQFTAGLSDGSAPLYSATLDNATGPTVEEYTVRYSAASAGQTLQLSFTMTANHLSGNISLAAATLSQAAAPATSTPTLISIPATSTSTPTTIRVPATSTSTPTSISAPATGTSTSTATATRTGTATATPTSTALVANTPTVAAPPSATKTATAAATSTPVVGSLVGTSSVAPSAVNLTSEGTADWADWGLSTASSFDHKANVSAQFSTYTLVKGGTALRAAVPSQFTWSDGTPDPSGSTTIGVAVNTLGQGFTLGVPASPIVRTLHLYIAVSRAGGQFTAGLSDGSAPLYSATLDNATGPTVEEYTVRYSAASAGQTLQLSFTMTANHFSGNISLVAATLS